MRQGFRLMKFNNLIFVFLALIIGATACGQNNDDVEYSVREFPGSVLRNAASVPSSVSDELVATDDYNIRIELAVATCMRSNGFDYFPNQNQSKHKIAILGFDLPPAEFARRFGFGISNGAILGMKPQDNSNNEYRQSLGLEEIELYWLAMNGTDRVVQSYSDNVEVGGCRRQALETVEQPPWYTNQEWLSVVASELFERLSSDPRIIEVEQQWTVCMAELGYDDLVNEESLAESLNNELAQLFRTLVPTRPFDDGDDFVESLDEESKKNLDAFRTKEIELAIASHECSYEHDDLVLLVSKEIEREIILANPLN